jgi:hypothetical protein
MQTGLHTSILGEEIGIVEIKKVASNGTTEEKKGA